MLRAPFRGSKKVLKINICVHLRSQYFYAIVINKWRNYKKKSLAIPFITGRIVGGIIGFLHIGMLVS